MHEYNFFKGALEAEKALVYKQLTELGIQNPSVTKDWIATPEKVENEADENIVADRAEEWIEDRGEVAVLETRYNNILRALDKINTGTFGICEICGREIEHDRLEANPAARTCKTHLNDEALLPL